MPPLENRESERGETGSDNRGDGVDQAGRAEREALERGSGSGRGSESVGRGTELLSSGGSSSGGGGGGDTAGALLSARAMMVAKVKELEDKAKAGANAKVKS